MTVTLPPTEIGFRVMRRACSTCIYRKDCSLDIKELEAQVADKFGGFERHRQCHHTGRPGEPEGACCRGFWNRHKNKFQAGQLAQRLGMVVYVDETRK